MNRGGGAATFAERGDGSGGNTPGIDTVVRVRRSLPSVAPTVPDDGDVLAIALPHSPSSSAARRRRRRRRRLSNLSSSSSSLTGALGFVGLIREGERRGGQRRGFGPLEEEEERKRREMGVSC